MLILTCKPGQAITANGPVTVHIFKSSHSRITIGFEADSATRISRIPAMTAAGAAVGAQP